MSRIFKHTSFPSARFMVLSAFIILAFLTGGGARGDIQSLIILRPVAILICCAALCTISVSHLRQYRPLFLFAAIILAVACIHIIPLPHSIWTMLPARDLITEIDREAGIGAISRPISLVPELGRNAVYSLFVPLAVLLLGVQLTLEERFDLLKIFVIIGIMSGLIGLLQVVGDPVGPLYFYRVTNNGSAVGFFANRNHQAIFLSCLFPLLALFASANAKTAERYRIRLSISAGIGVVLIPLLLVTGSRLGILTGMLGIISAVLLYKHQTNIRPDKRKVRRFNPAYAVGAFAIIILGLISILFSRAQAFQRLLASDETQELRFQIWGPIIEDAWKYFPVGSGSGSFVQIYQVHEKTNLLFPNYVNHAHNDVLEVFLTFGLIGIGLILAAFVAWLIATKKVWRDMPKDRLATRYGRLASVLILILAIASLADYPLRTPSIMTLWTVACLWFADSLRPVTKSHGV